MFISALKKYMKEIKIHRMNPQRKPLKKIRKNKGSTALLIQNFKKGCAVVARNFMCFVCKIKVVMFQLIINTPTAKPTIAMLSAFTLARYSGARKRELAP